MKKGVLVGLGVVLGVTMIGVGALWFTRPSPFYGAVIEQPVTAPDFTLTDQQGQPFRLSQQTGRAMLLFFGYTSCPDECPATLVRFQQIRAELGRDADHVQFLLISVDPETDSPAKMSAFIAKFDPTFIGLTGARAELAPVWQKYGVTVNKLAGVEIQVEHSTRLYAIDTRGNLRLTYDADSAPEEIASDLRQLARNR